MFAGEWTLSIPEHMKGGVQVTVCLSVLTNIGGDIPDSSLTGPIPPKHLRDSGRTMKVKWPTWCLLFG